MMGAALSSKIIVLVYQAIQLQITEDHESTNKSMPDFGMTKRFITVSTCL